MNPYHFSRHSLTLEEYFLTAEEFKAFLNATEAGATVLSIPHYLDIPNDRLYMRFDRTQYLKVHPNFKVPEDKKSEPLDMKYNVSFGFSSFVDTLRAFIENSSITKEVLKHLVDNGASIIINQSGDGFLAMKPMDMRFMLFDCDGSERAVSGYNATKVIPHSPYRMLSIYGNANSIIYTKNADIVYWEDKDSLGDQCYSYEMGLVLPTDYEKVIDPDLYKLVKQNEYFIDEVLDNINDSISHMDAVIRPFCKCLCL